MTPPKVGSRFDWAVPDSWHGSPGKLRGRGCRVLEFRIYGFGLVWFGIPGKGSEFLAFQRSLSDFVVVSVGLLQGFSRISWGVLQGLSRGVLVLSEQS